METAALPAFDNTAIREVVSEHDFERWFALFETIFFDPEDKLDKAEIHAHWSGGQARARLFFLEDPLHRYPVEADHIRFGRSIGILMANVDSRLKRFAYVPYGGLHPDARGDTGTKAHIKENALTAFEALLRRDMVKVILIDCEDPDRAQELFETYQDLRPDKYRDVRSVERYTRARIHLFARRGYNFIFDREYDYCRPASREPVDAVQDYDVLGFKIIEPKGLECPYLQRHFRMQDVRVGRYIANQGTKFKKSRVMILDKYSYKLLYSILHTLDVSEPDGWKADFAVSRLDYMPWFQEWSLGRRYRGIRAFYARMKRAPLAHRFVAYNKTSLLRRGDDIFGGREVDLAKIETERGASGAPYKILLYRGSEGALDYLKRRSIAFARQMPVRIAFFVAIVSLGVAAGVPREVIDFVTAPEDWIAETFAWWMMPGEAPQERMIGPR